jgi:hypothetical protein
MSQYLWNVGEERMGVSNPRGPKGMHCVSCSKSILASAHVSKVKYSPKGRMASEPYRVVCFIKKCFGIIQILLGHPSLQKKRLYFNF